MARVAHYARIHSLYIDRLGREYNFGIDFKYDFSRFGKTLILADVPAAKSHKQQNYQLPTTNYQLPTTDYRLLTTDY